MSTERATKSEFSERSGILFLASFNNEMYYNGDAIWYFIKEIYPNILKETASAPIHLTIAGRNIPSELRSFVANHKDVSHFVTFVESPDTIEHLFERHRVFIAPHLYGSGIQYKVRLHSIVSLRCMLPIFLFFVFFAKFIT